MSGITYNIIEYLVWISVGLVLILVIFLCVSAALAISSAVEILAMKWNLLATKKPRQVLGLSSKTQFRKIQPSARWPKIWSH